MAADYFYLRQVTTGDVGKKFLQRLGRFFAFVTDGRGSCNEPNVLRVDIKGLQGSSKQQGQLSGLASGVGMSLVYDYVLQLAAGFFKYGAILWTNQHHLQHCRVCNQQWWGRIAQVFAVRHLGNGHTLLVFLRDRILHLPVVKREAVFSLLWVEPCDQALFLASNQSIEWIDKQCLYANKRLVRASRLRAQVIQYWKKERLRFTGASSCRHKN